MQSQTMHSGQDGRKKGEYIPPTGPHHQISLTHITNHQKSNSPITKILMYESVDSRFHAALWSCRERFTCY